MIDVMFFLLATFILATLSWQNMHSLPVDLPQGKASPMNAQNPITVTVTKDSGIFLDGTPVTISTLAAALQPMLKNSDNRIVVAADNVAPQGVVVQAMLQARLAGAEHFLIAVQRNE